METTQGTEEARVTETRRKRLRKKRTEKEDRKAARQRRHRRTQTLMISRRGLREYCLISHVQGIASNDFLVFFKLS